MNDSETVQPNVRVRRLGWQAFSLGMVFASPLLVFPLMLPLYIPRDALPVVFMPGVAIVLLSVFVLIRQAWAVRVLKLLAIISTVVSISIAIVLLASQKVDVGLVAGAWGLISAFLVSQLTTFREIMHTRVEGNAFQVILPSPITDPSVQPSDNLREK